MQRLFGLELPISVAQVKQGTNFVELLEQHPWLNQVGGWVVTHWLYLGGGGRGLCVGGGGEGGMCVWCRVGGGDCVCVLGGGNCVYVCDCAASSCKAGRFSALQAWQQYPVECMRGQM